MTDTPAARLLALLEVLQARPTATGADLAARLGVTTRTLRRYVRRLVDLGIPVESETGPYGGYRLLPGYRLPPLMVNPQEAVAMSLGLLLAGRLGVGATLPAAASALAKLQRVLPADLRRQVQALESSIGVVPPGPRQADVAPEVLTTLGTASAEARRVRVRYRSHRGEETERDVDPYGVVFHAGRWYLAGHDHLREATRTFRIDRVADIEATGERFRPPAEFDAVEHVVASLASVPYGVEVEVVLHVDVERARALVPPTVGTVAEHPDGASLRVGATSPEDAARHLVWLGAPFTVVGPEEVREAVAALARLLADAAQATSNERLARPQK